MNLRFYVDPITEDLHIHNHGVNEEEVDEVLSNAGEDRAGREGSRTAIGQTASGRFLRVIYVPDSPPESALVLTAYELRGKPLLAYRRRLRRRSKR